MNTFTIERYEEGGIKPSQRDKENLRLVCVTEQDEIITIWGTETKEYTNRKNVDAVVNAVKINGFPCKFECVRIDPKPWAKIEYKHDHWVKEDEYLKII